MNNLRLVSVFCWSCIHSTRPQPTQKENQIKGIIKVVAILHPNTLWLPLFFSGCGDSGVAPGRKRAGLACTGHRGDYVVSAHLLENKLQKCVRCNCFLSKESTISLCTVIHFSPLCTPQFLIKELIYSMPQQCMAAWKGPVRCITSNLNLKENFW